MSLTLSLKISANSSAVFPSGKPEATTALQEFKVVEDDEDDIKEEEKCQFHLLELMIV